MYYKCTKILKKEIWIGRSFCGFHLIPKLMRNKLDTIFSWLGGCIVWSRLKRTHKNTDGVQKD